MFKPGARIETDTLSDEGYKVVAVIGGIDDFAVYQGRGRWPVDTIAREGDKISEEQARRLFPELSNYMWRS